MCSQVPLGRTSTRADHHTLLGSRNEPACKCLGPRQSAYKDLDRGTICKPLREYIKLSSQVSLDHTYACKESPQVPYISLIRNEPAYRYFGPRQCAHKQLDRGTTASLYENALNCARKCARKNPWTARMVARTCPSAAHHFGQDSNPPADTFGPRQSACKDPNRELSQGIGKMIQTVLARVLQVPLDRTYACKDMPRAPYIISIKKRARLQIPWTATERLQVPDRGTVASQSENATNCARKCARKYPWTARMPARTCPSTTHHFDQDTNPPASTLDRDRAPTRTWTAELLQGAGRMIQTVLASVLASTLGPHICLQGYAPSTIHHFE